MLDQPVCGRHLPHCPEHSELSAATPLSRACLAVLPGWSKCSSRCHSVLDPRGIEGVSLYDGADRPERRSARRRSLARPQTGGWPVARPATCCQLAAVQCANRCLPQWAHAWFAEAAHRARCPGRPGDPPLDARPRSLSAAQSATALAATPHHFTLSSVHSCPVWNRRPSRETHADGWNRGSTAPGCSSAIDHFDVVASSKSRRPAAALSLVAESAATRTSAPASPDRRET